MKAFIALGKNGDILSVLPILFREFELTGEHPYLVVSRQYADLLKYVSYVRVVVWDGHWQDLTGAMRFSKEYFDEVVTLQVFSKDFSIQKRRPSFQIDQWQRAGCDEHFGLWKGVVDLRDKHEESLLTKKINDGAILIADFSESSPFPQAAELVELFKGWFPNRQVVRLSEFKSSNIANFLGLYDKAELLVSVETAHLHLSASSTVPVIALATDKPSKWHGSAWQSRYLFYVRYSDFNSRKSEMFQAADSVLNDKPSQENSTVLKTQIKHGYNPSYIEHGGKKILVYRHHATNSWHTKLSLEEDGVLSAIHFHEFFEDSSIEDPKLFVFGGKLHISFIVARAEHGQWFCWVAYGELFKVGDRWEVDNINKVNFGDNSGAGMEKNWVFFENNGKLMALYGEKELQVVVEVNGELVVAVHKSSPVPWDYGEKRGGCIVPLGDNFLRIFHSHRSESGQSRDWIYYMGAVLMESKPPFAQLQVRQMPLVSGDEKWLPDCKRWKPSVVFPGAIIRNGSGWDIYFGSNDCECKKIHITEELLRLNP